MTIQEFLSNPELVTNYKRVVNNDVFLLAMAALKDALCRPPVPNASDVNKSTSEFCLGQAHGTWTVFDAIERLAGPEVNPEDIPDMLYGVEPKPEKNAKG